MTETNVSKKELNKENRLTDSNKRQKIMSCDKSILKNIIDESNDGVGVLKIDNDDSLFDPEDLDNTDHYNSSQLKERNMNAAIGGVDSDDIEEMMSSDIATPNDLIAAKRIFNKKHTAPDGYSNVGDNGDRSAANANKLLGSVASGRIARSPLATVNNNTPQTSESACSAYSQGSGSSFAREKRFTRTSNRLDESFFLYRKRGPTQTEDVFNKLSDEMILQIFQWLPKKTLIRCTEVCTRFNRLACDEFLWIRMDLGGKTLRNGVLAKIIYRGVVILRLAQAELPDPIFDDSHIDDFHEFEAKLQFLDLSMCVISSHSLKQLLAKCRKLKKLSLEHVKLDSSVIDEISENTKLEALNLAMCEGLEWMCLRKLMISLTNLQSLNISWTFLTTNSVEAIVTQINPNLLRLNIAGCRKSMTDSYLTALVDRCPGLLELDLSDCTLLTSASIATLVKLNTLEYLSLSRCYSINVGSYLKLNTMSSLIYLDVFGLLSEQASTVLEQSLKNVQINKFMHSAVARPTVGTRRTSVWGLRTRD